MKTYYLIMFQRKSGKIVTTMSGLSSAMLRLVALQKTTPTRDTVIFDEDGEITFYVEGQKDGFPKAQDDMCGMHIDKLCPGLLEALKADCAEA